MTNTSLEGRGVIINTIDISKDIPIETILDRINDKIANYQAKYIVIAFQDFINDVDRKKTVENIKKCFDIFIVLKSDIPNEKQRLEEYFSYGVHGLYFNACTEAYSKEQVEIMTFATELFSRGWVFASTQNNKSIIRQLLSLKIIPVLSEHDPKLIQFVKSHKSFDKISPNLKSVPLLDQDHPDYSLTDRIKMKMILETINLRQKLMLKNVDESFGSSGL